MSLHSSKKMSKFLQSLNVSLVNIRFYGKHNKKFLYKDGVKYENIIYYPRKADEQDPPITPSKLLRVQRVKPVKGTPYWERRILKDLGLVEKAGDFAVVKNIPENNARLWKIKHLIKIVPVTFPFGEPTENDVNYTFLKENGECIVTKEIGIDESRMKASERFEEDPKRLDTDTLRRNARLKWLTAW